MKIYCGLSRVRKFKRPVVALGVFDGVHLAHRVILEESANLAHSLGGTAVVVTFWPHPQGEESLYSLEHRLRLIGELGIDACVVINFNKRFSEISAEGFVRNILVKKIGAQYVCIGKNFRFGKGAKGSLLLLERLSRICNFRLKVFDTIGMKRHPISSTYLRRLIAGGDLKAAQKILGRPVSILGTVIRGACVGRKLGFATANINPHHEVLPPSGIYAVKVIFNGKKFKGVCYIGIKPTFRHLTPNTRQSPKKYIEVHVFNFHKDIYGDYLEIQFLQKIRDELKFAPIASLAKQIKKDIVTAKKIFSSH